ncbi:hypothetical protein Q8A73_006063 [Channa argus]|nr:hypothetical protein Q8A73_006063 [Channa argus]
MSRCSTFTDRQKTDKYVQQQQGYTCRGMKMKNKLLFVLVLVLINVSAQGLTNAPQATSQSSEMTTALPPVSPHTKWKTPATETETERWTTGQTEWTTGQTGWTTGQTGWTTGQAEWTTGQAEWTTGQAEWTTGQAEWTTGQAEWTTDSPGLNLRGKMFTLSVNGRGGITLYRPYFSPPSSPRRYTFSDYPPWTTSSPSSGVSVCLRYITDFLETKTSSIFTLSPSSNPLQLGVSGNTYWLSCDRYTFKNLYLEPSIRISSNIVPEIWNRVCLTVDSRRNVAQVFSGSNMSIRKFLPNRYTWSGDGSIVLSGFNGQVTDLQVWDYTLRYGEVYNYMTGGVYRPYRGSVLSWSHVRYSISGKVLLEDAYEWQGKQLLNEEATRVGKKNRVHKHQEDKGGSLCRNET